MDKSKILKYSFLHAFYVVLYVLIVVTFMSNSKRIFDGVENMFAGLAMLLLFVTSASITGGLIVGKPLMMYLDGDKKEALAMFMKTVMWLAMWVVLVFGVIVIFR